MTDPNFAKTIARKKRIITEIAGQIHDIVEDGLWTQYQQLPALSEQIQALMADLEQYRQEHAAS